MLKVEYIPTPSGPYLLPNEEEMRAQRRQVESLKRQADTFHEEGLKTEREVLGEEQMEGIGAALLSQGATTRALARELEERLSTEERIRELNADQIVTAAFEAKDPDGDDRRALKAAGEADPKAGHEKAADVAFSLLCPNGVKPLSGWEFTEGDATEELTNLLKARALAAFHRQPSEERRAFLLGS